MISLAAIGALGLYFSKRRKEEELEFVPEQAGYGASTNTKGNKARFFQTLRKPDPIVRSSIAKTVSIWRKRSERRGKMIKKIRGNST
ncbi:hypothetical protein ICE98_01127 [Lactococcus lactis]|nr:hypothetical protein [Lactococcus lactis]